MMQIAEKKNQLFWQKSHDASYDQIEREIRELVTEFQFNYGAYIEEALFNVHDEYCPDNEVLNPAAYLANHYLKNNGGLNYDVEKDAGIPVEADDFPGIKARLVLVPGPTRLVLQGQDEAFKEIVWTAREELEA